jgi:CubicO group peptidase (beta-lactamase class C family)
MNETGFLPGEELRKRAAPTEKRNDLWMQGEVHDPRAYHLGGVAGHAGLFSTAEDLAVYAAMMAGRGRFRGTRILSEATWREMTGPHKVSRGIRGLGWDKKTGFSSNRGEKPPSGTAASPALRFGSIPSWIYS